MVRGPGRKLSPQEAEAWARVARTVAPIAVPSADRAAQPDPPKTPAQQPKAVTPPPRSASVPARNARTVAALARQARSQPPPPSATGPTGLDSSWDRKLARGAVAPDFTLDLHGATLEAAYSRLLHGLAQARSLDARVVLVITGKPRPVDAADRGTQRGAIRAKIADWLAASGVASDIAAIRNAHRRHGGSGALYVILKRRRG
ncbi:DNA mismatch repair protein MutS [Novosphingobium sp. PC22D]|uniref:Smr/MutS family protein n=1 Tax=Novosphingobium sp. PC22D TaxID=1962403 RepID=UPI000BF0D2A7|nr:Smr/MutS family protein [Novosphingobium sp. PC22D]PEQ13019.1 DNA mismatch repair protein MutS [Novosphingobium sp. PC22D]